MTLINFILIMNNNNQFISMISYNNSNFSITFKVENKNNNKLDDVILDNDILNNKLYNKKLFNYELDNELYENLLNYDFYNTNSLTLNKKCSSLEHNSMNEELENYLDHNRLNTDDEKLENNSDNYKIDIDDKKYKRKNSLTDEENFEMIKKYFDIPITEASDKCSMCLTKMKKICRKFGVKRWPYRKLKSIDKQLSILM